jgi:hypothetical protein
MSSSSGIVEVQPAKFGGWGQQTHLSESECGGLKNITFLSRVPTIIGPASRILAVCGITDHEGCASPAVDGWFMADFYLFFHLLRGLGNNQIWLTSEDPEHLVNKYECYGHGNPFGERKVVLSRSMVPDIMATGNLRVVSRKGLCERFTSTVRSEARIAAENEQPLLILIFGHGHESTYHIDIGYEPVLFKVRDMERLVRQKRNLPEPQVSVFLTSCYSGGWAMSRHLDVTTMTASGPTQETLSWPLSKSLGRACGSIYATAVLKSLLKIEDDSSDNIDSTSSSYADLSKIVYTTLCNDVYRLGADHDIKFSAQSEKWDTPWDIRSGIPFSDYNEKWSMLESLPPCENDLTNRDPTNRNPAASQESRTTTQDESGTRLGRCRTGGSSLEALPQQARSYLNSHPGPSNISGYHFLHFQINKLLNGEHLDDEQLNNLQSILQYRLNMTYLATQCKNVLGLDFVNCEDFDLELWKTSTAQQGTQNKKSWNEVFDWLTKASIFPPPNRITQGYDFTKPKRYLAIAITNNGSPAKWKEQVLVLEKRVLHHLKMIRNNC